jgi:hypothetical protein
VCSPQASVSFFPFPFPFPFPASLLSKQVTLATETCGHTSFTTHTDTWYTSEPFHCGDTPPGHVGFWDIYEKVRTGKVSSWRRIMCAFGLVVKPACAMCLYVMQVALTGMLWGAGTAIGEIPPYIISYSAASRGRKVEALQEVEEVSSAADEGGGEDESWLCCRQHSSCTTGQPWCDGRGALMLQCCVGYCDSHATEQVSKCTVPAT